MNIRYVVLWPASAGWPTTGLLGSQDNAPQPWLAPGGGAIAASKRNGTRNGKSGNGKAGAARVRPRPRLEAAAAPHAPRGVDEQGRALPPFRLTVTEVDNITVTELAVRGEPYAPLEQGTYDFDLAHPREAGWCELRRAGKWHIGRIDEASVRTLDAAGA